MRYWFGVNAESGEGAPAALPDGQPAAVPEWGRSELPPRTAAPSAEAGATLAVWPNAPGRVPRMPIASTYPRRAGGTRRTTTAVPVAEPVAGARRGSARSASSLGIHAVR